ncbi:hypothetical protein PR048_031936 [Dryococelus australis]|uniref:Uncharacterized protein n=1 Tax=Dryococelus australis TaxID=614101 RepID=A0ABQ9G7N5_9NEOP|nr:hypothetical protein PR048_031936 [Dryococelus australis]
MEMVRARGFKPKLPFQEAIQTNLFLYLKNSLNVSYITTVKLDQDILEYFFSYVRATGHEKTHPMPQQNTKDRVEEMCLTSGTASTSQENITTASKEESFKLLLHKELAITNNLQDIKESVDYCEEDWVLDMKRFHFPGEEISIPNLERQIWHFSTKMDTTLVQKLETVLVLEGGGSLVTPKE